MAINVNDLPPKYQRQALEKYMEQQARRGLMPSAAVPQEKAKANKYHNTPAERVTASGAVLRFDSQKEARRYDVLAARLQAGQIRDLRLQVEFTLQEAYTDTEGRRVRAIRYKADFTYKERDAAEEAVASSKGWPCESWRYVVEDVKSRATKTQKYVIKKKLLKERFGLDITEV